MINDGWTFGIITDGYHQERVTKIIRSIAQQKIKKYEIILVGDNSKKYNLKITNLTFHKFKDVGEWNDSSINRIFPISAKKNIIINKSKYDKICFLHDYVILDKNWYRGVLKFSFENDWDILTNKIYNQDGTRVFDWVIIEHPLFYKKVTFLPYDKSFNSYQYIPGYYWCAKTVLMKSFKLNENLNWGEKEDIDWSFRVRKLKKFSFNPFSKVKFLKLKDGPWQKTHKRNNSLKVRSLLAKILFRINIL